MEHARRAVPRLGALFNLQAEEFQAGDIGLFPLLAGVAVIVDVAVQIANHRCDGAFWEVLGQVAVKIVDAGLALLDRDVESIHVDVYSLGVNDLNLNWLLHLRCGINAFGLLEECFVNVRGHISFRQ